MSNVKFGSSDFNRSQNCSPRHLLFVTLMSTVCVIVTADRSIILQNFVEISANQLDVSSRLASCTVTFVEKHFEDEDRVLLLLSEVLQNSSPFDFVKTLMRKLYARNSLYTLDMRLIDQMATYEISFVIIPLENAIAFEKGDLSFRNYCNGDCNLVIVLTNPFDDEESFLNDSSALTHGMRTRSIEKLVILASVGDAVLFADILAVRIDRFYAPAKPRLHGRCERDDAADATRWHFNMETESSAVGSTINAAIFDYFPYTFITNYTGSPTFGGIEGWMVEEIVRSMNVKLNRQLISDDGMVYKKVYLRLYNATDDLVCGGLFQHVHMKTYYTVPYGAVQVAWMIPMIPNVSLRGLITSFRPSVWYALICTLIIGGLVKFFIRDINMLHITALLLNNSIRQPRRTSSRILFLSWTLFGFFITQYYLGSLADQLISTTDEQIDTMEELLNSGLMLGGTEQFTSLLEVSDDETDENDKIVRAIHDKYIIFEHDDFIKQFADLVEGKNTSLALLVMLNLTDIPRTTKETVHVVKEIVGSYPLALSTWAGFPYLKEFNLKITAIVQAGLIDFWSRMVILYGESYYVKPDEVDSSSTLDITDIAPAFLLLIIGYCGAFCLLIIEVIFYPSRLLM